MAYYTCIGIKYLNNCSLKKNDLHNYVTNHINLILQPILFSCKVPCMGKEELWMTLLTHFSFWTKSIIVLGGSELVNMKTPTCTDIVDPQWPNVNLLPY